VASKPDSHSPGFSYYVSDEQLAAFALLTPLQRLEWVEAAREFSWLGQTAETRVRQQRLREGKSIC
jgi:hypothetical protein